MHLNKNSKKILTSLSLALSIFVAPSLLAGCESTTTNSSTTNRTQLLLVSSAEVQAESNKAYAQVLAEAKSKGVLNTDAALTKRVRAIADKLIAKAPKLRADSANWDWQVNVITSDELNAWCMAGGKIAVYTALVKDLKLSDAELATVMGHEIAHALREHIREQMSAEKAKQGAFAIASLLGASETTLSISSVVANVGISLPFSRSHETEADELGLELMYLAGYDPELAVGLWEKMSKASGGANEGLTTLLSTHPADSERMANIARLAKELKAKKATK